MKITNILKEVVINKELKLLSSTLLKLNKLKKLISLTPIPKKEMGIEEIKFVIINIKINVTKLSEFKILKLLIITK